MTIKYIKYRLLVLFSIVLIMLTGCEIIGNDGNVYKTKEMRVTLGDLTKNRVLPLNIQELENEVRTDKLAELYHSILTLEPDANVRAQIQYRLVQLNIEAYEAADIQDNDAALETLVKDYKKILITYPNRADNELIRYELAKALDLQGKLKESLQQIEILLKDFPQTSFYTELQFRRGEIYYNLQHYLVALEAYQAVLSSDYNEKFRLNSLYMMGWTLFKLNRLPQADLKFIEVLSSIISDDREQLSSPSFSFKIMSGSKKSLAQDTQRILSVSLSQQQQSKSLLTLLARVKNDRNIGLIEHVLFENLALFLQEKELHYDGQQAYKSYINYAPDTIWGARFTLELITLYQQNNNFEAIKELKEQYVLNYNTHSAFWQKATEFERTEVIPQLLSFSLQHSRRIYAYAQEQPQGNKRQQSFVLAANWLKAYIDIAQHPAFHQYIDTDLSAERFLFADASFESLQYQQALQAYQLLAYGVGDSNELSIFTEKFGISQDREIRLKSAYATTVIIRKILGQAEHDVRNINSTSTFAQQRLIEQIAQREILDRTFVEKHGDDIRAIQIAVLAAQNAYLRSDSYMVNYYSNFILQRFHADAETIAKMKKTPDLSKEQLKQVQIASQLKANSQYQQLNYAQAEVDYTLALNYLKSDPQKTLALRELIASCVYSQAQAEILQNPTLAVEHFMRLGQLIPESKYRVTAEFDAANLLLTKQKWNQAITVMLNIQKRFPQHEFSASIPAKLAMSYEQLGQWQQAAQQLLVMVNIETSTEAKREAQYTAAEYYEKAGDLTNAIINFRTYALQYPEPFGLAQEVRFKMSEFYRETKEPNKRFFWYRTIISSHNKQAQNVEPIQQQRSVYLASLSAFQLAQAHQQTFNVTQLKVPLNKSLKRKQAAMKEAIKYYQQVFVWQLAEFVPNANYNLAQMYSQLARDIMSSQRPKELDELALEEYELLLEEIAFPFEEKAIEIHLNNAQRAWKNVYDEWIKKSFLALAQLEPAKYDRHFISQEVINAIH